MSNNCYFSSCYYSPCYFNPDGYPPEAGSGGSGWSGPGRVVPPGKPSVRMLVCSDDGARFADCQQSAFLPPAANVQSTKFLNAVEAGQTSLDNYFVYTTIPPLSVKVGAGSPPAPVSNMYVAPLPTRKPAAVAETVAYLPPMAFANSMIPKKKYS